MSTATAESRPGPATGTARQATFAALGVRNYRIYVGGQAVANTGTWIQNIALDWLVLQLTGSAAAVGIAMALQFTPILFLGMHGGMLADRCSKRAILVTTQALNGVLAGSLAVMTLTGRISVGAVYAVALVGGVVFAIDNPTRQVFVGEVVPARHLRNAVALNAAVFQSTRLVGPAVASVLIGTVGTGWAFAVNALCYVGPTIALGFLRTADLRPAPRAVRSPGQLRSALRYVADRPHVAWTIALVGVVGTFGLNFPVVLTAMASETFGGGAGLYGLFNIVVAVGSIAGALLAGSRTRIRLRLIVVAGAAFGAAQVAAALAPTLALFVVALVAMGITNLAFQAMANSSVQLSVDPEYRGRVMGLYMLVFIGGTPIGAPLIGYVTEHAGVRTGMALCGLVPALAAVALGVLLSVRAARSRAAELAA